jgi:hypothetical protein
MPIVNRGHYSLNTIFDRQVANDWPTAQVISTADVVETTNLYFTDERASSNTISLMQSFQGTNIVIEANGRISADVSSAGSAETANTVQSLSNLTTDDLAEGTTNLYYTNARTRSAFTAGRNITIVEGIISSRDQDTDFNLSLDGFKSYRVTSSLSSAFDTLLINTDERVIMKSIYVTNISDSMAYLKSNLALNDGNSVTFAYMIPVSAGSSLELLKRDQVFSNGDTLNVQGFDSNKIPASDVLDLVFTYQTINSDESYTRAGGEVLDNSNVLIYDATETYAIIESIRIVNIDDTGINVSKLYLTDANDNIQAYFAYNLNVPASTSIELLTKPKRLNEGYRIYANKTGANCSVLVSLRKGETLNEILLLGNVAPGSNITVTFVTNLPDGSQVYYEIA